MGIQLKVCSIIMGALLLGACAQFATPVAVLPQKPEHEGIEPTLVGVACTHQVLWLISFGDSHVREAKKNGGISEIATVEVVDKVFLANSFPFNIYRRQCTEVSGYS